MYITREVTLKKNFLNFVKHDKFEKDILIERKTSGLTGLEVVIAILNQRDSDVIIKKGVQIAEK